MCLTRRCAHRDVLRKGNLTATARAVAARAAEASDDQMRAYMRTRAIPVPGQPRALISVHQPQPAGRKAGRTTAAGGMSSGRWFVVYVEIASGRSQYPEP